MEQRIERYMAERAEKGLKRTLVRAVPRKGCRIEVDGRLYFNFSSNDYLGLSEHPDIASAAKLALGERMGSGASRLMTGTGTVHLDLEEAVARFKGKEAALIFNSGYQANVGIISALCGKGDVIFSDRLNHASIVDGIKLSGAGMRRFRHNDTSHLAELLREDTSPGRRLIVTETVFSMDGDMAPLEEITRLKKEYGCMLMVDEAHATGVFGANGSGVVEKLGIAGDVDILMGTFSKALGGFGAYAACSGRIREYLINTCRSFIYSTSLPPAVAAADLKAIEIVRKEPYRREELLRKSAFFREGLRGLKYAVTGESQIIPVVTGDNEDTLRISRYLRGRGYWVTPVRPPTVPEGGSRIRISVSFAHPDEVLEGLARDIRIFHDGR